MTDFTLSTDGQILTLMADGKPCRFHAMWLRDNAWDADTRAAGNGQRLVALRDIPADTKITEVTATDAGLSILFSPEEKRVDYDVNWLLDNAYDRAAPRTSGWLKEGVTPWTSDLMSNVPIGDFAKINTDPAALRDWLGLVNSYGFGKIENGPTEDGSLFKVVDLFGFVRDTNYGRHFEVRTEVNPTNLAFTGLGLQAHTDNPYRDPVPSVQVLYCLESSAAGGENMVVDGFAAALRLQAETPAYFDVLAKYCARFEYSGEDGVCLTSRRPMIELAPDGELIAVRFNNRSLGAVNDVPFDDMATYYAAYRRLGEIIDDPAMEVTFRLEPGESFVVDNTRVLHARKAYSGAGTRWLQGCYSDKDGLRSTYDAMMRAQKVAAE